MPDTPEPAARRTPAATPASPARSPRIDWIVGVPGALLLLLSLRTGLGAATVVGGVVALVAVALPAVRPPVRTVLRPIVLVVVLMQLAALLVTPLKMR